MKHLILSSILAAALVVACSSSSDSTGGTLPGTDAGATGADASTGGGDSSTGTDSSVADSAGGGTDAGTCGTAALQGAGVPEVMGVGSLPTPAGGGIADGTYVLTKWEIYGGGSIDAFLRKETIVFSAGTFAALSQRDTNPEKRNSGTTMLSGTTVSLNVKCPITATVSSGYTATATELKIIENDASTQEVHTYTKQ